MKTSLPQTLRNKDVLAGLMFMAFGAIGLIIGLGYPLGSAAEMGAGYVPVVVSLILCALGAVILLKGAITAPDPVERMKLQAPFLVLVAVIAFSLLIDWLGLILACIALIAIASLAARDARWWAIGMLIFGLTLFAYLLFALLLNLPLKVLP